MSSTHEYFVAGAAEFGALDLAKSPAAQLPPEAAAELPGVDPTVVLLSLIEVLTILDYHALLEQVHDDLVFDGGEDGPWVVAIDPMVVDALRGADGDPEMDWEDTVTLWSATVAEELGDPDDTGLLEITDELRRLAGSTAPDRRLYCWTA